MRVNVDDWMNCIFLNLSNNFHSSNVSILSILYYYHIFYSILNNVYGIPITYTHINGIIFNLSFILSISCLKNVHNNLFSL